MTRPLVLVVDDDRLAYEYVRDVATGAGWDAAWASDGAAALDRTFAAEPALLLVDLRMPGVDGVEFLHELNRRGSPPTTLIVLVTGNYSRAMSAEMQDLGVTAVLSKPVAQCDLQAVLGAARELADRTRGLLP